MRFQLSQMYWGLIIVVTTFVIRASGDFVADANALINSHKTVRFDPLLRRALLKALTELEEEAQRKAEEEDAAAVARAAANDRLQQAVGTADPVVVPTTFDEIQTTADTSYPTPSPLTTLDTEPPTSEQSTSAPTLDTTSSPPSTESQTTPTATIQDTFFFQTPTPLDGQTADLTKAVSLPEIESNFITDDRINQQEGTSLAAKSPTQQSPTSPLPSRQVQAPKNDDVDIFKAPLVAAFTLHQDDRGTPKRVVPLFRPQTSQPTQSSSPQFFGRQFTFSPLNQLPPLQAAPQNFLIQQSRVAGSFTLNPSQQLQRLQQPPHPFSINGQFVPQGFSQQQNFNHNIGPFGLNTQIASGQQQLPSPVAPILFNHQVSVTSHSEPINHNNNFASTFPPLNSVFPVTTSTNPQPVQSTTARPITIFQSSTPVTTFTIPPVTLPLQNEPRFQSPIIVQQPSQETRQFLDDQHKRERLLTEEKRLRQLEDQAHFRLEQVKREREAEEKRIRSERFQRQRQPSNFQRSVGFDFNPDPFQNSFQSNRVNRQEPFGATGNFGFNSEYRTIPQEAYRARSFRSPQQELAQFLYQSGVATHSTGQEDLNIVSKVLALNHERSDDQVEDSQRTTTGPKTQSGFVPSTFLQRRADENSSQADRRSDEKTLLVGEIKEFGAR